MKRTVVFLALLIALLKFTQAQPALSIFSNSIAVNPDTVTFYDTVSISFNVVNTGNQNFNGTILIRYSVGNFFPEELDSFNAQIDTGQLFQVVVNNYAISPPKYAVGDNIVVIWPVALNGDALTSDSGTTHIYVDTLLGIGSPSLKDQIKIVYKFPAEILSIDYGDLIGKIDNVTCYSILGEQMAKYSYAVNEISLGENPSQIFLLAIRTKDGETITFKILRL